MCSALFGHEGEHLLGTLITRQLFLCKIDEQSGWYSFHPLFNHMLLAENEESLDAFYLKVSVWYEQKGLGVGAIDYALMANDPQRAAKLAESMTESILADQDIQRLKRWRKALPNSLVSTSPHLTLLFSWAAALAMQLDDAEQLIEQIDFTKYDGAYEGRVLAIEGYIARGRGDITRCIELCELALVMMKGHSTVVSVLVMSALGNAYLTLKDVKQSEYYNQASLELARRSSDGGLEMLALYDGARIEMAKGQLKTAQRLLNSAQEIHKGMGLFPTTAIYGRILMTQGSVAWLQNDVDKAQDFLKEGIRLAEDCHDVAVLIGYIVHSALLRQQRRYDEAMDLLFRAERTMQVWNVPRGIYNGWISAVRANLWIDQGKVSLAEECLSTLRSMNDAAPEYFPALPGCIDLFYARVKVAAEDYDGALFILDRLVKDFQSNQFGFNHTLCLLLRALVLYHTKNESAALSDLNEALRYAEPENCISPFLEYSDKLLPVIKKIPSPSVEYDFLQKLLKQIDVSDEPTSAPETGLIALSARELGVLKLIAQGCSNQDIADKLYISLHTVKTHARKINNKLVSKSRTQAIVKARELGLI
jgi:LuxR family maltose regulon positive regulatory protein